MATALDWLFALEGGDPVEALRTAAGVLEREPGWSGPWTCDGRPADGAALAAGATGGWTMWRLHGQREVREPVSIELGHDADEDRGCLRWRLADVGPLCAVSDASGAPKDHPFHARALENAERCMALGLEIAAALDCPRARAHTDAGARELWNAHVVYWRDERAAADELGQLAARGAPDLGAAGGHAWRGESQRAALEECLSGLDRSRAPSPEHVRALLESGRFDVYRADSGFAVLEHPWYVNAFVDRFLLAAFGLELASGGARG